MRKYAARLLMLSLPTVIEEILATLLQYVDTAMVGRTRYAFGVETAGMWGVRILSTFLCVRVWGLGLRAVWYCMIADNICKALLFAAPFLLGQVRRKRDDSGKC